MPAIDIADCEVRAEARGIACNVIPRKTAMARRYVAVRLSMGIENIRSRTAAFKGARSLNHLGRRQPARVLAVTGLDLQGGVTYAEAQAQLVAGTGDQGIVDNATRAHEVSRERRFR